MIKSGDKKHQALNKITQKLPIQKILCKLRPLGK